MCPFRPDLVTLAWFGNPEEYQAHQELSHDMSNSYEEWLGKALVIEEEFKKDGHRVMRVRIDPICFQFWCIDQGVQPSSQSCAKFVSLSLEGD